MRLFNPAAVLVVSCSSNTGDDVANTNLEYVGDIFYCASAFFVLIRFSDDLSSIWVNVAEILGRSRLLGSRFYPDVISVNVSNAESTFRIAIGAV